MLDRIANQIFGEIWMTHQRKRHKRFREWYRSPHPHHTHYFLNTIMVYMPHTYPKTSDIRRILVGNIIVDHSDVAGASAVGAAPTASFLST